MPKIPVDPSSITADWLSQALRADVRTADIEQIAVGVGLLGRLFRVRLTGIDVPESVVIKMPTLDARARSVLCEDLGLYQREIRFYQEIGLSNPLRPARPYFAAIDETTHDFVLILEDVGHRRRADQITGCAASDAETVIDAIAAHHAHWWNSDQLASLTWLTTLCEPPFSGSTVASYQASWPEFLGRFGDELSPETRAFGERFLSLMPWLMAEISRPPNTFLHGDLRLDQLFFAAEPGDPPLTALDWQLSTKGRGAYDLAYFISQSLTTDTRRACERQLLSRYADRLAAAGIDYAHEKLSRDYRLATAWCFAYPVLAVGQIDVVNDRQRDLLRAMTHNAAAAAEDHDAFSLRPD